MAKSRCSARLQRFTACWQKCWGHFGAGTLGRCLLAHAWPCSDSTAHDPRLAIALAAYQSVNRRTGSTRLSGTLHPLRERRWDIPKIAVRYLNRTDGETDWELDGGASELLASARLEWDGNIRELEAVLERARNRARASGSKDPVIEARHINVEGDGVIGESKPHSIRPSDAPGGNGIQERWQELGDQKQGLDGIEKAIIEDALAACRGIVARTARVLSVPRTGLISRMATLEIDPEKFKERRG